jgi:hypothetical protein
VIELSFEKTKLMSKLFSMPDETFPVIRFGAEKGDFHDAKELMCIAN